jgi:hypothetical protein
MFMPNHSGLSLAQPQTTTSGASRLLFRIPKVDRAVHRLPTNEKRLFRN